ncbi:hypothetical protein [Polaromonas vacuolata]|uniref:hypothetical protein n=1 Tax=Polaromonas vacuolata TaxID=37448 RepID=UPI001456D628|nr:hypothetical protein [Polaromonas vacuolata]
MSSHLQSNEYINVREPEALIEIPRRRSCCASFGSAGWSGFMTLIRTIFIVGTTGSVGLAIKTGLVTSWDGNKSTGNHAIAGTVAVVVGAGATFVIGPRLAQLSGVRGSSRCATAVRFAFGAAPLMIFGSQLFACTQIPRLQASAITVVAASLGRVVSAVLRDMGTQFSKGFVPRLDALDTKTGRALLGDSEIRLAINRHRTAIATLFYLAISFVYFHYEDNSTVKSWIGVDDENHQKGSFENFNAMFLAGMPDVLRRTLAEAVDDFGIAIAMAIATHFNDATLSLSPTSGEVLRSNFAPNSQAMDNALDASSMRVLMSSVSLALENSLKWFPIESAKHLNVELLNTFLRTIWGGFTELRGFFVGGFKLEVQPYADRTLTVP